MSENPKLYARNREIRRAYQSGRTMQEIGAEHGITKMRVCQIVKAGGLSRYNGGAHVRSENRVNTAADLLADGVPFDEVVKKCGSWAARVARSVGD